MSEWSRNTETGGVGIRVTLNIDSTTSTLRHPIYGYSLDLVLHVLQLIVVDIVRIAMVERVVLVYGGRLTIGNGAGDHL